MAKESGFNVAIIGAGIGGLGLAIGLNHLGVPFTIYESAPAFSAVGAGVGLGPNALRAMDLIDKRFRDMYMNIATGNLRPEKKHVMMEAMRMEAGLGEGEDWWGHGEWGAQNFERTGAHRKDLLDIMTSFIPKESVRFNKRVTTMKQANGIAGNQASQRVSYYTDLLDVLTPFCQFLQLLLDLLRNSFSAQLDPVVCEAARVAFGHENVQLVLRILLSQ